MSLAPALPPPPGQKSNFTHPESLERWTVVCVSTTLSIATLVFFLRSYVRIFIKRSWVLEDSLILISWAAFLTLCALTVNTMHNHGGIHIWDLTKADVPQALYWFNAGSIVYGLAILFTKVAILLLYRRVFVPHREGLLDWGLRVFMGVLIAFYLATTLVKIWECNPRERIWDKSVSGHCVDIPSLLNTSGLFNSVTDVMILLVPVKAVWKLHISMKKKFEVAAVFTFGFCAPVFSTIGFVVRLHISASQDVTWHNPEIQLWGLAEIATALICVCIPELAALVHRRASTHRVISVTRDSRPIDHHGVRNRASSDEQHLWDGIQLRQQDPSSADNCGIRVPPATVVTDIEGGFRLPEKSRASSMVESEGNRESIFDAYEPGRANGIYTSVRMEQTVS